MRWSRRRPQCQAGPMHDDWGIADGYHDVFGAWHQTSDETRAALRRSMGEPTGGMRLWFVPVGSESELTAPCSIRLEDGGFLGPVTRLPHDLPMAELDQLDRPATGRRDIPLWDGWWSVVLLVGCFGGEWILRRRLGAR